MAYDLSNQTIIITGATTGLGKHTAKKFIDYGANVCIFARQVIDLEQTVEEFSLELTEGEEAQGEDDIRSFDDFGGEEEDFGGEEAQDEDEDELQDEIQDEMEEEEEESENKLESFQSFINKRK